MRVRERLVGSIRAVNQLMKIIEQGHCGGSEQKEGKWPWRHNIGKTTELTECAHVRAKSRHAHIPSERQRGEADWSLWLQRRKGWQHRAFAQRCTLNNAFAWLWRTEAGCLMNVWLMCPTPVAKVLVLKALLSRLKSVVNGGPNEPTQPPSSGRENVGLLTVIVWQTRRAKKSVAHRGSDMLSKTSSLSQLPAGCWLQTSPDHLSVQKGTITWWGWMHGGIASIHKWNCGERRERREGDRERERERKETEELVERNLQCVCVNGR